MSSNRRLSIHRYVDPYHLIFSYKQCPLDIPTKIHRHHFAYSTTNASIHQTQSVIILLKNFFPFRQIIQVSANDIDTGNNARITYRIIASIRISQKSNMSSLKVPIDSTVAKLLHSSANASDIFGIYPHNGWIYLRNTLDREVCDMYDVTVLASDNGTPTATAEAHVIVNVLDVNDNKAIFTRDSYEFSVEENVARNTILGKISATDADAGINAEIRYTLLTNNTNFHINSKSGKNLVVYLLINSLVARMCMTQIVAKMT